MELKFIIKITLMSLILASAVFAQKQRVAVYMSGKNQGTPQSEIIEFALTEALSENKNFSATERTRDFLKTIRDEHLFQMSGSVDNSQIAELGKKSGVAYVCAAELLKYSPTEFMLAARFIDVEAAAIVASTYRIATLQDDDEAMLNLSRRLANDLMADFEKKDRKAKKENAAIYLASGSGDGAGEIIQPLLINAVVRSDKYAVSERTGSFMQSLSQELGHQYSGEVADNQLTKLGYQAGVKYIIALKIAANVVNVRQIDVATGDILKTRSGVINTEDAKNIEKSVANLIADFLSVNTNVIFTELMEEIEEDKIVQRAKEEEARIARKKQMDKIREEEKQAEKQELKDAMKIGAGCFWGYTENDIGVNFGLIIPVMRHVAAAPRISGSISSESDDIYSPLYYLVNASALAHLTTTHDKDARAFYIESGAAAEYIITIDKDGFAFFNFAVVAVAGIRLKKFAIDFIEISLGTGFTTYRSGMRLMF
jgi:hypothetical protein